VKSIKEEKEKEIRYKGESNKEKMTRKC